MSGAEVIGVIAGIIGIVDGIAKVHSAANDASGLPEAFQDVAQRLPLVREILQTALAHLKARSPDDKLYQAIKPVLRRCNDKATRLEKLFEKSIPQTGASRSDRYFLAVRSLGKGSLVKSLMKGILEDVQLLADNHVMRLAPDSRLGELERAAEEVSAIPPSLPIERTASGIRSFGACPQDVNIRSGAQGSSTTPSQHFPRSKSNKSRTSY